MEIKKIAFILLIFVVGCFASIELSYGESGQFAQPASMKSETMETIVSEDVLVPSHKTEEWLLAHDTQDSNKKKRDFEVLGKPSSVVDYKDQTKEWEARTMRTIGLVEFFGGIGLAITGIVVMDDSAPAGLAAIAAGIGSAYIGYKDLKASKRFFYPNSFYSQKYINEHQRFGPDNLIKNKKDYSIYVKVVSADF